VQALERPTGQVVLTVSGRVRMPNDGNVAQFDMLMLAALPQTSFTTRTPWYAQPRRFTGPLLRDVLAAAGAQGTLIRLTALNDYKVELPFDDAQAPRRHRGAAARRAADGGARQGPLFVIYPFDARPELRGAVYYSRSAWQLRTIDVV